MIPLLQYSDRSIVINNAGLLLIDEFQKLLNRDKDRLFQELTYIYLMIDWRSPYADYSERERHTAAINDSHLTEEQWQDLEFRAACRKYKDLQESALEWRVLQSARKVINEFIVYFNSVDPSERDVVTGKPIFKVKDIMAEVTSLSKVIEELKTLEYQYKKQAEAPKVNRGGVEEGFDPRKINSNGNSI
jgi:hypothetical protein